MRIIKWAAAFVLISTLMTSCLIERRGHGEPPHHHEHHDHHDHYDH